MTIAENIYKIMRDKRQKQSAVAVASGYSAKQFNDMLRGRKRITSSDIPNICKGLGVSPNELFEQRSDIGSGKEGKEC